jgi:predicted RNase H-like HicB family nuclease
MPSIYQSLFRNETLSVGCLIPIQNETERKLFVDVAGRAGSKAIQACDIVQYIRTDEVKSYSAIIERCPNTGLFVGHVPGFPGAHSQAETLDELRAKLQEVIEMLLEDGEPHLDTEFAGIQTINVN